MNISMGLRTLGVMALALTMASGSLFAAPPCKGPNKNDPGCPGAEPPPPDAVVDSVTVDWFNQVLVVRGSGLSGVGAYGLGAFEGPLIVAPGATDLELALEFNDDMANEVQEPGNYVLTSDGSSQLTLFFQSSVVDPAAPGCPCAADWSSIIPAWGSSDSECLEVEGSGENDIADISGTVLSVPGDPGSTPQWSVGASFYPGEPNQSVCRLVEIGADLQTTDLVNVQINENQQAECREIIADNVCSSIITVP